MTSQISGKRKLLITLLVPVLSLLLAFLLAEVALRLLSSQDLTTTQRKIVQIADTYDESTGWRRQPGSTAIWDTGKQTIERKVNTYGFLDREHEEKKPDDTYRIGFFGDSFTEALQVKLEDTFVRLIEEQGNESGAANLPHWNSRHMETFLIAISGFSALQSYLNTRKYLDKLDLDMVVYVFSENDLGDQLEVIQRTNNRPYAELSEDGRSFRINNSFRENAFGTREFSADSQPFVRNLINRFQVLRVIYRAVVIVLNTNKIVNQNDPPSTWPSSLREEAVKVEELILREWKDFVESSGREFVVMVNPGESEWQKRGEDQDSWKSTIREMAEKYEIELIDPTPRFHFYSNEGHEIYDGHYSVTGHKALADAFLDWAQRHNAVSPADEYAR